MKSLTGLLVAAVFAIVLFLAIFGSIFTVGYIVASAAIYAYREYSLAHACGVALAGIYVINGSRKWLVSLLGWSQRMLKNV